VIRLDSEFIDEINHRVSQWERGAESFLERNEEISDMWRLNEPKKRGGDTQLTNTRTAEMLSGSESVGTLLYRMLTASDPNFDVVPKELGENEDRLTAISNLIQWQQMHLRYRKNLRRACASMGLFGTTICEERWKMIPAAKKTLIEGTEFVPRSLSQVAFNLAVPDITESDWYATIDFVSARALRAMAKNNPDLWDSKQIEDAIEQGKDKNHIPEVIKRRRRAAGYDEDDPDAYQLVTFQGYFDDLPAKDDKHWVVSVVNDDFQVSGHPNPFDHGEFPYRIAHYMSFELEPYGYGIGRSTLLLNRQRDAVRNLTLDTIIMALFNMWAVSTLADVEGNTMKMSPLGIVRAADVSQILPLRPDLQGAKAGLEMDTLLKEEVRGAGGATSNIQSLVTEATATESAIVQNEAMRRVGVYAEIAAEELVRKHLYISHRNNIQFLNPDIWLTVSGEEKPRRVNKDIINMDVDFLIKVTTDKDYRPQRMQNLLQYLQILSSVRQEVPNSQQEIFLILREIKRMFGIKTSNQNRNEDALRRMVQEELQRQQAGALAGLEQNMNMAQQAAQNLPPDNFISPNGEPGVPPAVEPVFGP
jgi:hypothetical protein